jgi:hypothetical protein
MPDALGGPIAITVDEAAARPAVVPDAGSSTQQEAAAGSVWEDGCGQGSWCPSCLEEVRTEALAWIRDLNSASPFSVEPLEVRRITGEVWLSPWET